MTAPFLVLVRKDERARRVFVLLGTTLCLVVVGFGPRAMPVASWPGLATYGLMIRIERQARAYERKTRRVPQSMRELRQHAFIKGPPVHDPYGRGFVLAHEHGHLRAVCTVGFDGRAGTLDDSCTDGGLATTRPD